MDSALGTAEHSWPRPVLFMDRGCPFAHRVLALLDHLDVAHDTKAAPVGQIPDGLEAWSPSGRIPLLVHGAIAIGESRVMLEHLAEAYAFDCAYPSELVRRTLHRHAMALFDNFLIPTLLRGDDGLATARLAECVDVLERVTADSLPEPGLLAFHLAPMWLRCKWWRRDRAITHALASRRALAGWLDDAARLPAIVRTIR